MRPTHFDLARCLVALLALAPAAAAQGGPCPWEPRADAPSPHFDTAAIAVGDRLYVFGGFVNSGLQATRRVDVYEPASDSWSRAADMPTPLNHTATESDGSDVWIAGGFLGNNPGSVVDQVWKYDALADTWSAGPPLPQPVGAGALARLGRNLHFYAGVLADRDTGNTSHWVLDLDDPSSGWSPRAPLPVPRNHIGSVAAGGYVWAVAGQERHDDSPFDTRLLTRYDPVTDTWQARANLPFPRSHVEASTFAANGRIFVVGGRSLPFLQAMRDVTVYDVATNTWSAMPSLPFQRASVVAGPIGEDFYVTCGNASGLAVGVETLRLPLSSTLHAQRVNAGGDALAAPELGHGYCFDQGELGGVPYSNPAVTEIHDTKNDELYRTARLGSSFALPRIGYRFPVDPGPRRVRLHFAEIELGLPGGPPAAGARIFDVLIEGVAVERGLDVAALVGSSTALVRTYDVLGVGGAIDLQLEGVVGRPIVNGIELLPLAAGELQRFCTSSPNSTGEPARLFPAGTVSVAADDLSLVAAPVPDDFGLFLYGAQAASNPFGNGTLCIALPFRRLPLVLAQSGELRAPVPLTTPPHSGLLVPGSTWRFQAWFRDTGVGAGFDLSDGLVITFAP